jgi:hypothetical protein
VKAPNTEYVELKARIDKWSALVCLIYPLIGLILFPLSFAMIGYRINPDWGFSVGFILGALVLQATWAYFVMTKIGFLFRSKEACQKCGRPYGRCSGWFALDYLCRQCGNNNSVTLVQDRENP